MGHFFSVHTVQSPCMHELINRLVLELFFFFPKDQNMMISIHSPVTYGTIVGSRQEWGEWREAQGDLFTLKPLRKQGPLR